MTTKTTPPAWAARVDALLLKQGQTRQWLAEQIGVSPSYVTLWMKGARPINAVQLEHIGTALGVPVKDWLERTP